MFQFRRLASRFSSGWYTFSIPGCPIRKSKDLTLVCSSPWLIAAYHVLLRLSDPRHPPCALISFKNFRNCNDVSTTIDFLVTLFLWDCFPNMSKNFNPHPLKGSIWRSLLMLRLRTFRPKVNIYVLKNCLPPSLKLRRLKWRITDSNRWPPACKAGALASWANPPELSVRKSGRRKAWKISTDLLTLLTLLTGFGRPDQSWTGDLYIISVAL